MSIYMMIVVLTLILGALMPQKGKKRIYYIVVMTVIHAFVLGFRYKYLTGDLIKYSTTFLTSAGQGWFSEELFHEGRNSGFYLLLKLVYELTGGDFQVLLILIAVVSHVILGYVIYRYSPAPWMSFLVWNCMALYLFGFSAIKQALAMSIVMLAFTAISEKRMIRFLVIMALAGFIHTPALIFLPAYWLAQQRISEKMILIYVAAGITIYVFKEQFIEFIASFYYEEDEVFVFSGEIGSRFIMLLGFTLFGIFFRGFSNRTFEQLFPLMAVATMLQLLAGFDNIFTRLTDYYFQFAVLYIPMTFSNDLPREQTTRLGRLFPFNRRSMAVLTVCITAFMIWFYWTYNINITIGYETDNYLNFRFMWDVK